MKKEIADIWVTALRSGEYRQGRGTLRKANRIEDKRDLFCCLGVLCDISKLGTWENKAASSFCDYIVDGKKDEDNSEDLPESVQLWAGMNTSEGYMTGGYMRESQSLMELNDNGSSFDQIANVIEENWERL